uniref:Uncharacterized protein n=1 Tax=Panagrellus redivivus TaxID=6233 RepID=A0A7E4W7J0_PANRE
MNLPQLTLMPSTVADVSIPTPAPEPDVSTVDPTSTSDTKVSQVVASSNNSPNLSTRPLPFSIEALLSKPTPSITSSSSDSNTSDETGTSTSATSSPMPIPAPLIDPISMTNPTMVAEHRNLSDDAESTDADGPNHSTTPYPGFANANVCFGME